MFYAPGARVYFGEIQFLFGDLYKIIVVNAILEPVNSTADIKVILLIRSATRRWGPTATPSRRGKNQR